MVPFCASPFLLIVENIKSRGLSATWLSVTARSDGPCGGEGIIISSCTRRCNVLTELQHCTASEQAVQDRTARDLEEQVVRVLPIRSGRYTSTLGHWETGRPRPYNPAITGIVVVPPPLVQQASGFVPEVKVVHISNHVTADSGFRVAAWKFGPFVPR